MKKTFVSIFVIILLISAFALSACGNKGETYYPSNEEMKNNLKKKGYTIEFDGNINGYFVAISMYYDGTLIKAVKGDDYIYFARLNIPSQCDGTYHLLKETCKNYNSLVEIQNDEKFGNIVYCGTASAIKAAGIVVVKVDADTKA